MNLNELAKKYGRHADRLVQRIIKANTATEKQKRGIVYYSQAAQDVRALGAEPESGGFVQRTAAQIAPQRMSLKQVEDAVA